MAIPKLIYYSDNSYITNQGTLLEDFENIADWTLSSATGTRNADSTFRKQGMQSLRLNSINGADCHATKTISKDLSAVTNFILWIYVHDEIVGHFLGALSYCIIRFASVADESKRFTADLQGGHFKPGWNRMVLTKADFDAVGGESWSNTMIRLKVWCRANTSKNVAVNFDDLRYDHVGKAKCILTFDDCCQGQYDLAKPIMDGNGQPGVTFCPTSWVDTAGDHLTKVQLTALQNAGWDISNHCEEHLHLPDISQVAMEETIDNGYAWLVANGFSKGARFFAHPYGEHNQTVLAKVKEQHRITRSTINGEFQAHFNLIDNDQEFSVKERQPIWSTPPATVNSWIDNIIIQKGLLVLLFHHIVVSGASIDSQYNVADFQTISNYLKTKEDAGLIDVITFSDYYDQFIPSDLTSVVYLKYAAIIPYPIMHESSENINRSADKRIKVYGHSLAGDRKRIWQIKCNINNSESSGYKWRDLEYFYWKVVEGAKRRCVFVDANSIQYLVRIIGFAPRIIGAENEHEVTMILEEDYI